ncbi:DUF1996 domain-containing protein [Umezawaea tangerina]|uniref:Uncharacterized protein DUF1996 n=1 Tax=Umezawaea tangerina TaxID=84725 RepID=A0A2T0SRT8_9PSEU|nr:DUF1996 domain-containing protein [Umezawaea tangerina]PRY36120.1 uncharacterized protein DUF1996 [Umezawaea tangerina]
MTRTGGRHQISSRTKIASIGAAVAIAAGAVVVVTTTGNDQASADGVDISQFVDITTVQPNVKQVKKQQNASKGTFTVNCGLNENGHFNGDNFIAAPGVENGAEHLHDYVGNLSTNANSTNESLQAAGTTCKNGDKSTYFWPVIRIDTADEEEENKVDAAAKQAQDQQKAADADAKSKKKPQLVCPDVVSKLDEVPEEAQADVDQALEEVDKVTDEAEQKLEAEGTAQVDAAIINPLLEKRKAILDRMTLALGRPGRQPIDFGALSRCSVKNPGQPSPIGDGSENGDTPPVEAPGGEPDDNNELPGNDGEVQRPLSAELTFRGSPVGKVTAMPKFLRILYGDAKVSINGTKNTRDSWTCSGFEDKVQIAKYVICPEGSKVKRIHDFPSCWDGKNTDSANHRTHIVFPDPATGKCADGFKAVPQLRTTLTYDIPRDIQLKGQYKVDSFPFESHNPLSDHDDFANVMSQRIMSRLVNCVNKGKTCKE